MSTNYHLQEVVKEVEAVAPVSKLEACYIYWVDGAQKSEIDSASESVKRQSLKLESESW